jgi:hypothetical protein
MPLLLDTAATPVHPRSRIGTLAGPLLVAAFGLFNAADVAWCDAKTNEHKATLQLLGLVPVAGKVVTGGMPSSARRK